VTVVTRKTPAPAALEPWQEPIAFIEADINDSKQDDRWVPQIARHKGVISCVGAFATTQKEMERVRFLT